MEIKITAMIKAPDGATHYGGNILDEPIYYKCRQIAGYDHWFHHEGVEWVLSGHSMPIFCKEITDGMIVEKDND